MPSADKKASQKSRLRAEKMRTKANPTHRQAQRYGVIGKEFLKDPFFKTPKTKESRATQKKTNQTARGVAKDYLKSGKTPPTGMYLGTSGREVSKSKSPTKPKVPVKGGRTRIGGLSGMGGRGGAGAGGLMGSKIR